MESDDERPPLGGVLGTIKDAFQFAGGLVYVLLFGTERKKKIATERRLVLIGGPTLFASLGLATVVLEQLGFSTPWTLGENIVFEIILAIAGLIAASVIVSFREKR